MTARFAPVHEHLDAIQAEINALQAHVNDTRAMVDRIERAEDETLVDVEEFCRKTNNPEPTVRSWIDQRVIPHYKIGGNVRINISEVLEGSRR